MPLDRKNPAEVAVRRVKVSNRGLHAGVAGTGDNVQLLLTGQVDELHGIAGNTDGEVRVFFLLRMLHGVQQLFLAEHVHVQVMRTLIEVAVHDLHEVVHALAGSMAQRIGVDGLGVGDAVQCPVIGQLRGGVQGRNQTILLRTVGGVRTGREGRPRATAVRRRTGGLAVHDVEVMVRMEVLGSELR